MEWSIKDGAAKGNSYSFNPFPLRNTPRSLQQLQLRMRKERKKAASTFHIATYLYYVHNTQERFSAKSHFLQTLTKYYVWSLPWMHYRLRHVHTKSLYNHAMLQHSEFSFRSSFKQQSEQSVAPAAEFVARADLYRRNKKISSQQRERYRSSFP